LILRSRKRKSVKLFKARAKKFLLRRFLPKTKAFVFFRTGQYIYKVLSYKSKNYFNFESNAGPYHLFVNSFLSQRIKLLKSIVKSPFNKD